MTSAGRRSTISTPTEPLLLATLNAHKVGEIREILEGSGLSLDSLASYPDVPEAPETGQTYRENALQKARFYHEMTGRPCLADDSGLEIDALDGAPGLHSSRFGGAHTPHSEKMRRVLEALAEVPEDRRTARFRCVAALVGLGPEPLLAEGICEGRIARVPAGCGGFGYDPIFLVPAEGCTMAELPEGRKHQISHRGQAMRSLARLLKPS